jgi:hypothetical protein
MSRAARLPGAEPRRRMPAGDLLDRGDAARIAAADWRLAAALPHASAAGGPLRSDLRWRARGACLQEDPELFFPHPGEDPSPAVAVCRRCSEVGLCLATALTMGEVDGIWGATTGDQRRAMRPTWLSLAG